MYLIADIASNHDGNLDKAKDLIKLASDCGAQAVKFQHFRADKIIAKTNIKEGHHKSWKKSVYDTYKQYELPWVWTEELKKCADDNRIAFLSTPYDLEAVDHLEPYVDGYKIGSGDITWLDLIEKVAHKKKPTYLSTGASTKDEIMTAARLFTNINIMHKRLCVMQCNSNYTGEDNFKYQNLNVLKTFKEMFRGFHDRPALGFSDHTLGHSAVLGALMLGAMVAEKHFTDSRTQEGPDHFFSMDPPEWRHMVKATEELESALGDSCKEVEENELESVKIQRRCYYANKDIKAGEPIRKKDVIYLRPAQEDCLT